MEENTILFNERASDTVFKPYSLPPSSHPHSFDMAEDNFLPGQTEYIV